MSKCLFIHNFFQDGRLDVLAEIRVLQGNGQWTQKRRAHWTRQAKACFERSKHMHFSQTGSYYAGRIAGLKSAITACYPALEKPTHGKTLFLSIADEQSVFCGSCGDQAIWKYYPDGDQSSIRYRCDR